MVELLPRFVRQRDAPAYLGMDRNRFDDEVRPFVTEMPIGVRGIAYDRQELDAWADDYIAKRGRPGRAPLAGLALTTSPEPPPPRRAPKREPGRKESKPAEPGRKMTSTEKLLAL